MKTTTCTRINTSPGQLGFCAALTLFTLSVLPAGAATVITVTNPSFEANPLADGATSTSVPTGWTSVGVGATVSYFNPLDAAYPGSTGGPVPTTGAGDHAMYVNMSSRNFRYLKQTTSATITEGLSYTLTVAVGAALGGDFDAVNAHLRLGYGSSTYLTNIAENIFVPADKLTAGEFKDFTVSFTAQAGQPYIGQNLAIFLGASAGVGNSARVDFDNVRLISVPEPSAALLGGLGLLFALLRRRR